MNSSNDVMIENTAPPINPGFMRGSVIRRTTFQNGAPRLLAAWEGILEDAGLGDDVVRHSLHHTAATWLMQQGTDHWQAAGWLGMTLEQLETNYGHHHSDFQGEVATAFSGKC
jgi:integrase